MAHNATNPYDIDLHIAEAYDAMDFQTDDVDFLHRLIGARKALRILEPFTGTGRILVPLACDGHTVTGIDQAQGMLARASQKVSQLPADAQQRITLIEGDVICAEWPGMFDLVVLAGNCFYKLATPEEQEQCIRLAAGALKPGGYVYVDNDHQEGDLAASWQDTGVVSQRGIQGTCADGSKVESWMETVWFDAPRRLARFRRRTVVTLPDGQAVSREYFQQKHPVSAEEERGWLVKYGFEIEQVFGDYAGSAYTPESPRAIFWAVKR